MNATIRIRRAQLRAAMTSQCAQLIAALQEGRRLVHASVGSRQHAALAGISDYRATHIPPARLAGDDAHDAPDPPSPFWAIP